ncbi:MAG: hypothetical protein HDS52_02220 [Barnesiella sp.]|nr:hypothetical protein [Barnesiella sp.]
MTKQEEIYSPLLKLFCDQNGVDLLQSGYPYLPFLPVAFERYERAQVKMFYVGIDTYYWITGQLYALMESAHMNNFHNIINLNNQCVTPYRILEDWYNDKGRFWEFVVKLHLYIRTEKILNNESLRNLSVEETNFVKEIGWGNMNSIELSKTLKKEGIWDSLEKNHYNSLKQSSELILDPLINLINAYNPDYLIILGWGGPESHVFKDLDYQALDEFYEESFRALYLLNNYKTKIVWTSHPSRFRYMSTNQDEMIPYIGDSLKLF